MHLLVTECKQHTVLDDPLTMAGVYIAIERRLAIVVTRLLQNLIISRQLVLLLLRLYFFLVVLQGLIDPCNDIFHFLVLVVTNYLWFVLIVIVATVKLIIMLNICNLLDPIIGTMLSTLYINLIFEKVKFNNLGRLLDSSFTASPFPILFGSLMFSKQFTTVIVQLSTMIWGSTVNLWGVFMPFVELYGGLRLLVSLLVSVVLFFGYGLV